MISLQEPTLFIDGHKCRRNIEAMARKAAQAGIDFHPHFKTHQSREIGNWFKDKAQGITVSSMKMAEYFAQDWSEITLAFPFNPNLIPRVNQLPESLSFNVVAHENYTLDQLSKSLSRPVGVFIKIDTGSGRVGLPLEDESTILSIIDKVKSSDQLYFKGFYIHSGHTYSASGPEEIGDIHRKSLLVVEKLKEKYQSYTDGITLSIGDTPGCSLAESFSPANRISPGNFVFYDLMQHKLGVCSRDQIAVAVACPVVAVFPERNEIAVHGGAVHFSKEYLKGENDQPYFGEVTNWDGLPEVGELLGARLSKISQEHGIIKVKSEAISQVKPGQIVPVLPVHSCLTANLLKSFTTANGLQMNHLENQ